MYPKSTIDKVKCLESLVGIRTLCSYDTEYPFFIEDIEGVDVSNLAKLAKGSNLSGEDFGKQLINSAARELIADIELLMSNGYSMKAVAGDMCSACSLLPTYTANTMEVVKSNITSRYQMLQITKVTILVNVTGEKTFIIDDGVTQKEYTATFEAGVNMPIGLDYITDQKSVELYFQDATVGLGRISCALTDGGCGCGSSAKKDYPFTFSGKISGTATSNQYGFLVCAAVTCSYDALICNLIKLTPNVFGQTLSLKVGEKYYLHKSASGRNNETASFNEEEKSVFVRNYSSLYAARLYGKSDRQSVRNIISNYLKTNKDKCVTCDANIMTASVTG